MWCALRWCSGSLKSICWHKTTWWLDSSSRWLLLLLLKLWCRLNLYWLLLFHICTLLMLRLQLLWRNRLLLMVVWVWHSEPLPVVLMLLLSADPMNSPCNAPAVETCEITHEPLLY